MSETNSMYKSNYSFRVNIMEEIFEAVHKFWQMTSKSTQMISRCSTVNKELQGHMLGGSSSFEVRVG